jgi:hypothetical protein
MALVATMALLLAACSTDAPASPEPAISATFTAQSGTTTGLWSHTFTRTAGAPTARQVTVTALDGRATQEMALTITNGRPDGSAHDLPRA